MASQRQSGTTADTSISIAELRMRLAKSDQPASSVPLVAALARRFTKGKAETARAESETPKLLMYVHPSGSETSSSQTWNSNTVTPATKASVMAAHHARRWRFGNEAMR